MTILTAIEWAACTAAIVVPGMFLGYLMTLAHKEKPDVD